MGPSVEGDVSAVAEAVDRRQFIGGSDISAILGISPWQTPYQLWVEKTSDKPIEEDPKKAAFFRRRKMMEPYVIDLAREEHGLNVVARNARYYDSELPFLSCEVDFEHEWDGWTENADVKTVHPAMAKHWGEPGTDEIPQYYTAQFLWGLMITARFSTLCMAMIGIDKLEPYRVKRNDAVITWMREQALRFWELVEKKTPPEITTLDDAKLAWRREQQAKQIVATPEILAIAERLALMKKAINGRQAEADLLELDLRKFMGSAEEIIDPQGDRVLTWKTQIKKSYTVQASESRVMRLAGRD
jgi:putative phage-type endonuclease